jgi:hypothetical protein
MGVLAVTLIASAPAVVAFASTPAAAASCSSWKVTCVNRANSVNPRYLPQCDAKFDACLTSGCFAEGARFGAATHCGLTKK